MNNSNKYYVTPISNSVTGKEVTVCVPGSKSITNRALLLSALSNGTSTLSGVLFSDDSRHFLSCLIELGFPVSYDEEAKTVTITGFQGEIPNKQATIYVGSAGTAARFLTAMLGFCEGTYTIEASNQMKKRPMDSLMDCLEQLGCHITYLEQEKFLPCILTHTNNDVSSVTVNIEKSSQFLSALLISSCLHNKDLTIHTTGTHGMSYIHITTKMMEQFGYPITYTKTENGYTFFGKSSAMYQSKNYFIEPDVSSASYFYAMAALFGCSITVKNVFFSSMQGDIKLLSILEQMGCTVVETEDGVCVTGPSNKKLKGLTIDMSSCSDQTMTVACLSVFADSKTTITGISHIRFQESNRIKAICTELTKMGIDCVEFEDGITITPGTPKPTLVNTYEDHRMAMAFSLIGLRSEGIVIDNPSCCSKTFETYFEVLENTINRLQTIQ